MGPVIRVTDLVKQYGSVRAVDGVSFDVRRGEVFALLGPNGAGKSTTVEILEGHRRLTSGEVRVLGVDPATARSGFRDRIGIVLQTSGIDPELTTSEVLSAYGSAYSRRRSPAELMELVGLAGKAHAKVRSLSGGQQRRLDLALGLLGDPELIFLDEPTTGFDPEARRRSWRLVEQLTGEQRTVVLTTHYLEEAEHLADRVAVLSQGRIVASGTPAQLRSRASSTLIRFLLPDAGEPVAPMLEDVTGQVVGRGRHLEITTDAPTADLAHLTGWACDRGLELQELTVSTATLEDVYLSLVGEDTIEQLEASEDTAKQPEVSEVSEQPEVSQVSGASTASVGGSSSRRP